MTSWDTDICCQMRKNNQRSYSYQKFIPNQAYKYTQPTGDGFAGWHGATFPARSAICFEAQHFPDTPNKGHFPSAALNPGEVYHQVTVYKFGIEQ